VTPKVLPMKYPTITSYPYHANLLAVISNNNETLPWFYSNYIQLEVPDDIYNMRLDFYSSLLWKSCPYLYYQRLSRNLINKKWKCISEFIIDCIDSGQYVYFLANYFFIPVSRHYKNRHYAHDIFVYGYDRDENVFFVADFFKDGKYSFEKVDIQSLIDAYNNLNLTDNFDWLNGVELISFRKNIFRFNLQTIIDYVSDYINSENTSKKNNVPSEHYKHCWSYGIDVYKKVAYYTQLLSESKIYYDIRPFQILFDHKVIMTQRIQYLEDNDYLNKELGLSEKYKDIQTKMQIVRNKVLIAKEKDDKDVYIDILDKLSTIKELETSVLKELIKNLKITDGIKDDNIAESARIDATSLSLNKHNNPLNIIDKDMDSVYASNINPTFPVYITLHWDNEKSFNTIMIKTRFAQSLGITQFDIQILSRESNWITHKSTNLIKYSHDDYTIETVKIKFESVVNSKGIRLKINEANRNWGRFEINWLGVYKD